MRYIYLDLELSRVTVLPKESALDGELIGKSASWENASPTMKKFIVWSLINNTKHRGLSGLTIDDCDRHEDLE